MFRQKHFKSFVIASVAMLGIISCKQENTTQPIQPAPVTCRMAETQTTFSNDVIKKHTFFYNESDQITKTVEGNVLSPTFFYDVDETLTYDQEGRLLKVLATRKMYGIVQERLYTWGSNGLLAKVEVSGDDTRVYVYRHTYDTKQRRIQTTVEIAGKLAQKFRFSYNEEGNVAEVNWYDYLNDSFKLSRKLVYTTFDDKPFIYAGLPYAYSYGLMFYGGRHTNNPIKGYLLIDSDHDEDLTDEEKIVISNKLEYNEEGFPTKIYSDYFDMTITATYKCK